jgi:hypothetical protein
VIREVRNCAVALVLCALAGMRDAEAQLWPPTLSSPPPPAGDLAAAGEAARGLYESDSAKIGQSKTWSNPASGSSGTVTLVGEKRLRGMDCRILRYEFNMTKPDRKRTFHLNWCRTPEGNWRIAE